MICVYAMHSKVRNFKFVVDKKEHTLSFKEIIVWYIKASWAKYYKSKSIPEDTTHPLWSNVSVESLFLVQKAGELQDLLLASM